MRFRGWVNWPVAGLFVVGDWAGGVLGSRAARRLSTGRQRLAQVFAGVLGGGGDLYDRARGHGAFGVAQKTSWSAVMTRRVSVLARL
jgi:hypothetical protein